MIRTMCFILVIILVFGLCNSCREVNADPFEQEFKLYWTAPGDDGLMGQACEYDMRYSTKLDGLINDWDNQSQVSDMPIPSQSGATDSVMFSIMVNAGDTVYFMIKTADDVPNWSNPSNIAFRFIPDDVPPLAIIDLRWDI